MYEAGQFGDLLTRVRQASIQRLYEASHVLTEENTSGEENLPQETN